MRSLLSLLLCFVAAFASASVLQWDAPLVDETSGPAAGYKLYYGLAPAGYTVVLDTGPAPSAVLSGLTPGTTYYAAVTAYNGVGESPFSEEVSWVASSAPVPDTTPPTVAITSPRDGQTVRRGSLETIRISAEDAVGVTRVSVFVNGDLLCTDTSAPYSCSWSVARPRNRTYMLVAQAVDAAGNVGQSDAVEVISR